MPECPAAWNTRLLRYGLPNISGEQVASALRGKSIVFMGDSLIRNLYMALMEMVSVPGTLRRCLPLQVLMSCPISSDTG
jgi:hypothetical protein